MGEADWVCRGAVRDPVAGNVERPQEAGTQSAIQIPVPQSLTGARAWTLPSLELGEAAGSKGVTQFLIPPSLEGGPQPCQASASKARSLSLSLSPPPPVVHAVDGTAENGVCPLNSSEVDDLLHKADEVALSEAGSTAGTAETRGASKEPVQTTPSRREIPGVQAQPGEATSGPPGVQPGQEPPVTLIFTGYQNVEDEAESQKVLGLQDTIIAELVVIEDAAEPKEPAPPNGSAAEPPTAAGSREENQVGPEAPASDPQDLDAKKQRCKCCSVM